MLFSERVGGLCFGSYLHCVLCLASSAICKLIPKVHADSHQKWSPNLCTVGKNEAWGAACGFWGGSRL